MTTNNELRWEFYKSTIDLLYSDIGDLIGNPKKFKKHESSIKCKIDNAMLNLLGYEKALEKRNPPNDPK